MKKTDSSSQMAPRACLACKSKKRKCDKLLPACTRCQRVSHACHYPEEKESGSSGGSPPGQQNTWMFKHSYENQPAQLTLPYHPQKSRAACSRCREGKRLCCRSLPQCSRCEQRGVPCVYDQYFLPLRPTPAPAQTDAQTAAEGREQFQPSASVPASTQDPMAQSLLTIDHNGHAHLDPFQTYPSPLGPACMSKIITYCVKEMWPQLFPGFTYKGVSFVNHWMECAMSCPPLFNAWLHSGAEHMLLRDQANDQDYQPSPESSYHLLLMEQAAITGLKDLVDSGRPENVSDEVVMSALALALHPPERMRNAANRMPPTPLANLQWLSRFTDIVISEGHVRGLRCLVQARGGFEKLEMPGLKQGLSTFDLVVASKYLTRPYWPLTSNLEPDQVTAFLERFKQPQSTKAEILHTHMDSSLPQPLTWVFGLIRGYSSLLEDYSAGLLPDLDMAFVLALRNLIHYNVLSLPASGELPDALQSFPPIYEACRLGLTAYSLLVLFPVPLMTEPYPRLAQLLRNELESTQMNMDIWMPMTELMLWVLTLGGIAALATTDRVWYVQQLFWLSGMLGIDTWEQLKDTLSSIIWLECPCDTEGFILWGEVQELTRFKAEDELDVASYMAGEFSASPSIFSGEEAG